ncbi:MAG: hypothetical protein ACE5DO_14540 [Desulfobacterales bacterium]
MRKTSLIWILSFLIGSALLVFQSISSLIGSEGNVWEYLSLIDLIDEKYLSFLLSISWLGIGKIFESIFTMSLFILLFCIGGIFFVWDLIFGRK